MMSLDAETEPNLCSEKREDQVDEDGANKQSEWGLSKQLCYSQRPNRPTWSRRLEFILAAVGYAVGFGNIWRFPWLLMKNGGGAFLIPYIIMLVLEGIPLFILELSIGQRHHLAPIPLWRKVSTFSSGVGVSQFLRVVFAEALYFAILSWSIYYFFVSFQSPLPWANCERANFESLMVKGTNQSLCNKVGPTVFYWYEEALQISDGFGSDSSLNWKMALCILGTGIIITLCLIRGIKSAGKVVYFTTIFPYIVLVIFLVRGLTLEGSKDGLKFLFSVDLSRLADPNVWLQASAQIFYSLSLASGGMVTYASYNPTRQDVFADALTISVVNGLTSLTAGLAVYCLLGHRAYLFTEKCRDKRSAILTEISVMVNHTLYTKYNPAMMNSTSFQSLQTEVRQNISQGFDIPNCGINKVLEKSPTGSGLAFITLTEVINQLPAATFFSILFFLMLITVGLDSAFGTLEAAIGSILDTKRFHHIRQEVVTVIFLGAQTLAALLFGTKSGEYYLQMLNTYGIDLPLVIFAFMEIVSVMYFYGLQRFCEDIKMMTGRAVNPVLKILLLFVSPAILLLLLVVTIVNFAKGDIAHYQRWDKSEGKVTLTPYPSGGVVAGLMILVLMIACLLAVPLYTVFMVKQKTSFQAIEDKGNVELKKISLK